MDKIIEIDGETKLIMFDGTIKKANQLQIGERLINDESTFSIITDIKKSKINHAKE